MQHYIHNQAIEKNNFCLTALKFTTPFLLITPPIPSPHSFISLLWNLFRPPHSPRKVRIRPSYFVGPASKNTLSEKERSRLRPQKQDHLSFRKKRGGLGFSYFQIYFPRFSSREGSFFRGKRGGRRSTFSASPICYPRLPPRLNKQSPNGDEGVGLAGIRLKRGKSPFEAGR